MKKFFWLISLFSISLLANDMLEKVLLHDVNEAISITKQLNKDAQSKNLKSAKQNFKKLVFYWKRVQNIYIAGDIDDIALDIPRFIDTYHEGNENIGEIIKRALDSGKNLQSQLFKTSTKTINALEYVLFSSPKLSSRHFEAVDIITKAIIKNLEDTKEVYENSKEWLKDVPQANTSYLNTLIDSAYKLKEWRIGETMGIAGKYKDKGVDLNRAEYHLSKSSFDAIRGILSIHDDVMGDKDYENFGKTSYPDAKDAVIKIRKDIKKAQKILSQIKDENFADAKMQNLYDTLKDLYLSYALAMVDSLSITAKIVEADGD